MKLVQHHDTSHTTPDVLWLLQAASLEGKAPLQTAVIILAVSQRMERRRFIPISQRELDRHCVSAASGYRALNALSAAGLITVTRRRKHAPLVDIIENQG